MTAAASARGTRLVLVRHAQSFGNADGVIAGHRGCTGLTLLGVRQAQSLAARLASTHELAAAEALYTSILPRAVETAEIVGPAIGAGGLTAEQTCELCEQHPGEADGTTWVDYEARFGTYVPRQVPDQPLSPGGESWLELLERTDAALSAVARRHSGGLVVVVTHGGVIDASLVRFLGLPDNGAAVSFRTWNASMTEWQHTGKRWALVHYNDTAHLVTSGVTESR